MEQVVNIGFTLLEVAWKAAQKYIGTPEWATYVNAGLTVGKNLKGVILDAIVNKDKYDAMTPAEIKELLLPKTWEELEAIADAELKAEGAEPPPGA